MKEGKSWRKTHWVWKQTKGLINGNFVSFPVRLLLSSKAVLYHVNDQLQRDYRRKEILARKWKYLFELLI